jgi:hypothetical protein
MALVFAALGVNHWLRISLAAGGLGECRRLIGGEEA